METLKSGLMEKIRQLSLEEKAAQLIMIDFNGIEPAGRDLDHLKRLPWGGVIIFSKNVSDRPRLVKLNHTLSRLYCNQGVPPFVSVDQEGGLVNRAEFDSVHLPPGNMALANGNDPALVRKCAFVSGVELREMGFHLNFAPVADVNVNPENPIIGVRSFGSNPKTVSKFCAAAVEGYLASGIAPCAKHFPGHGDTLTDSHLGLPVVKADLDRLRRVELPPFAASVKAGVPTVMTAHVHYPAVDTDKILPATMSVKILKGLLRQEMGFEGLIITDSMLMKAVADSYGCGPGAVASIMAGADVVMMCGTREDQLNAHKAVTEALRSGLISPERLDKSLERIAVFKERFVTNPPPIPPIPQQERQAIIQRAAMTGVSVLYDRENLLPLKLSGKKVLLLSPSRIYRRGLFDGRQEASLYRFILDKSPGGLKHVQYDAEDENDLNRTFIRQQPEKWDVLIMELYGLGRIPRKVSDAAQKACSLWRDAGVPVVAVPMASPYGLPDNASAAVTAFNCSEVSTKALAKKIFKG